MNHPQVFAATLGNLKPWATWQAALKAAFGLKLTDEEMRTFITIAGGRQPPQGSVQQLWAIVGRRGGKTRMSALIACYLATCVDHRAYLAPGERGYVLCLAPSMKQAHAVLDYCRGLLEGSPILSKEIEAVTADEIQVKGNITIATHAASHRTVRGRTIVGCVLDEMAMWRSEDSAQPDVEVLRALVPALLTTKGMIVAISTPYSQRGLLFEKFRDHFGKDDADVLVLKGSTIQFNPTADEGWIEKQLAADEEANRAEFLSEFRSDLSAFVDRATVERCIDVDLHQRRFVIGPRYLAFVDPSGGQHDSMTLGIAHRDGERVLLDAAMEWKSPFDPAETVIDIVRTLKLYRITTIISDRYAGQWVQSEFSKHGIGFKASDRDKSTIFLDALPLLTSGNAMLLDNTRLVSQITLLQREVGKGGRDRVVKMRGSYDDLANAALGALVEAAARRGVSYHHGDGGWPRSEPKVILRHPGSKVSIPRGTAYRRNVPSAEELTNLKVDKLRVGPHGHYYSPHGGIAGDGRQRYSLHAPDAAQLGLAWGEAEAQERLKAIISGQSVAASSA